LQAAPPEAAHAFPDRLNPAAEEWRHAAERLAQAPYRLAAVLSAKTPDQPPSQ
jgi:hypothetical protein